MRTKSGQTIYGYDDSPDALDSATPFSDPGSAVTHSLDNSVGQSHDITDSPGSSWSSDVENDTLVTCEQCNASISCIDDAVQCCECYLWFEFTCSGIPDIEQDGLKHGRDRRSKG